jgi:hypothetical protein
MQVQYNAILCCTVVMYCCDFMLCCVVFFCVILFIFLLLTNPLTRDMYSLHFSLHSFLLLTCMPGLECSRLKVLVIDRS